MKFKIGFSGYEDAESAAGAQTLSAKAFCCPTPWTERRAES